MRKLLFAFIFLFSISIISCSDSGTGPDPNNGNGDNNNEETTTYTVAVDVTPSDAGSISPSAEDSYEEGEEIELEADASDEYLFTHWSGDIDSTSENPLSLTVDQDYGLTANFELKTYELTINTEGEGSVSEEVLEQKTKNYEHGTVVELTAEAVEGYKFVEWQGDITGSENPAQITVDDPKKVTAIFEIESFSLSIEVSGEGSVNITPDQEEYEYGTEVDLQANPATDWEFESWDGDTTSSNNPITISIDSSTTLTAVFGSTQFAGGSGTENNPYQVSTVEQLQAVNEFPEAHFVQINDIDASETENWNDGKGFKPIGDDVVKFTGSYNGDEHNINNLSISRELEEKIGLFGYTDDANLKNINFTNANIVGQQTTGGLVGQSVSTTISNSTINGKISAEAIVGGLAGFFSGNGSIENSSTSGKVSSHGDRGTGGLIGLHRSGTIKNSNSNSNISGNINAGGLVGSLESGSSVSNSHSTGKVSGTESIGGLIGESSHNTLIDNSYSEGDVEGDSYIGGLIGSNRGSVKESHSKGIVNGKYRVGGLIGYNRSTNDDQEMSIKNSFSASDVTGLEDVGGLIGRNWLVLYQSYATGSVDGSDKRIGGLVGYHRGNKIRTSFFNGSVTGANMTGGLVGYVETGDIINSYSLGEVLGENTVGGLIGAVRDIQDKNKIKYSFSTSMVDGNNEVGALIGTNGGNTQSNYWDTEATNQSSAVGRGSDDGTTGLTTSEMTGNSAKDNMSDFNWDEIWLTTDNYPALFWEE